MINKISFFLLLTVFITGCNSIKRLELMKSGFVEQQDYSTQIPFELKGDLPIIKASINGVTGSFLFDTGAPNVLSIEFAQKLKLKSLTEGKVGDSGGNSLEDQSYVQLDNVKIGELNYKDTGAIVMDLGKSEILKCLNFDGIIGANLMRQSFWKIDYQNKTIQITDQFDKLNLTENYQEIGFKTKTQGTPLIDIEIGEVVTKNVTFDTGSNGHIHLLTNALKSLNKKSVVNFTTSYGASSYGVGGRAEIDSIYYGFINQTKIGELEITDKIVKFTKNGDTVGNKFLKNYIVILDWQQNKIYLKKVQEYDYHKVEGFGFGMNFTKEGLFVGSVSLESNSNGKLEIGDQILQINEIDFQKNKESICTYFLKEEWDYESKDEIIIKVLREGKTKEFNIQKKVLLSKKD